MAENSESERKRPGWFGRIVAAVTRMIEWVLSTKPARAFLLYLESHGPVLADSVTYRVLFSVFAAVFLGFAIAGIWLAGNQAAMDALVATLDDLIPGLVGPGGVIDPDDLVQPITLSIAGALALIGLVGAAIGAIGSLRTALRTIAGLTADKTFFVWVILRNLALAVGFGVALGIAAALTFFGTAGLRAVFGWLDASTRSTLFEVTAEVLGFVVIFAIDTIVVAVMVRVLSGVRPDARSLWTGALLGGIGLTALQALSGLFVGGATSNPLLASFGSLIALLLWLNLSSQVILIAGAYVITGVTERSDGVSVRYGAVATAERRVKRAERRVSDAAAELDEAREAVAKTRG